MVDAYSDVDDRFSCEGTMNVNRFIKHAGEYVELLTSVLSSWSDLSPDRKAGVVEGFDEFFSNRGYVEQVLKTQNDARARELLVQLGKADAVLLAWAPLISAFMGFEIEEEIVGEATSVRQGACATRSRSPETR